MLRGNLSTRPFYNTRLVTAALSCALGVLLALGAYDGWRIASLLSLGRDLDETVRRDTETAEALEGEARRIRQRLAGTEIEETQQAALEANQLIDQRAFSWTELFNGFEATLPADVRITGVQPQTSEDGRLVVALSVIARRVEHLETFVDRLEAGGGFSGVITRSVETRDDGFIHAVLQGHYRRREAAAR